MVHLSDEGQTPLIFKDASAAFEFACTFCDCSLRGGVTLPAMVLDAQKLFGLPTAVKIQEDGNQLAMLRVASDDGGFNVIASSSGSRGPKLNPGLLVAWMAGKHLTELAQSSNDARFGWAGLIVSTLKPCFTNGVGWERATSASCRA
jgi:hypothetical protein